MMKNLIGMRQRALRSAGQELPAMPTRRRALRGGLRAGEGGQALVEAAATLPLMLLVLLGCYNMAIIFSDYVELVNGVGVAATRLSMDSTAANPCLDAVNTLVAAAPMLTPSKISITMNLDTSASGNTATYSGTGLASSWTLCAGEGTQILSTYNVLVTATYPVSMLTWAKNMLPSGSTTWTLSESTQMYVTY
jgi:hypothetical protein